MGFQKGYKSKIRLAKEMTSRLAQANKKGSEGRQRRIYAFDPEWNILNEFPSVNQAAENYKISAQGLIYLIRHKQSKHGVFFNYEPFEPMYFKF